MTRKKSPEERASIRERVAALVVDWPDDDPPGLYDLAHGLKIENEANVARALAELLADGRVSTRVVRGRRSGLMRRVYEPAEPRRSPAPAPSLAPSPVLENQRKVAPCP